MRRGLDRRSMGTAKVDEEGGGVDRIACWTDDEDGGRANLLPGSNPTALHLTFHVTFLTLLLLEDMAQAECKTRISWKNVELVKTVIGRNENRKDIWKKQCFGCWLDAKSTQPDGQLIHSILLLQKDLNLEPEFDGIHYIFNNETEPLRFGPREFCVITGFKFGDNTNKNKGGCGFINRVLSNNILIPFSVDGLKTFLEENENIFDDADIVRLSLLLLLYSLFMGVQTDKKVEQEHLMRVDDFDAWNDYNWGSYLWGRTYPSLLNVLMKKKIVPGKKLQYSMTGFIWVFKV
ncbi:hypothetical protein E3N88_37502 [Mikania micrantha]|uniref:DUF1985 domain-containing protein n=1 Tax=Mikania micrantha TaxID=192012 RepID=A0A5N6LS98_9ASTR|nr:hypothetical protein E3N88_37502 [Mikania micrantha]